MIAVAMVCLSTAQAYVSSLGWLAPMPDPVVRGYDKKLRTKTDESHPHHTIRYLVLGVGRQPACH